MEPPFSQPIPFSVIVLGFVRCLKLKCWATSSFNKLLQYLLFVSDYAMNDCFDDLVPNFNGTYYAESFRGFPQYLYGNSGAVRGLISQKVFSKIIAIRSLEVNIPLKVFYNTLSGIVGNNSLRGFYGLITPKVFSQIMTIGSIDVNAPFSRFSSIPFAEL